MDFNKIRTFLVVAEMRGFSKAALALGRTQPAISQAVRQLEDDLGLKLLERKKGKIHLTYEGEELFKAGTSTLGQLEDTAASIKKNLGSLGGRIRVGAVLDHGGRVFAERLICFRRAFPRTNVHVSYMSSNNIERALIENEVDIGILVTLRQSHLLESHEFFVEEEIPVAAPLTLKRYGPTKSFDTLLERELLDLSPDFLAFRSWLEENSPRHASLLKRRVPAMVVDNHYGMREVLISGFGIGMLPKDLVREDLKSGSLKQLFKQANPTQVSLSLVTRKKRNEKLVLSHFVRHMLPGKAH